MLTCTVPLNALLGPPPPLRGTLGGCRLSQSGAQGLAQTSAGTQVHRLSLGATNVSRWSELEKARGGHRRASRDEQREGGGVFQSNTVSKGVEMEITGVLYGTAR